MVAENPKGNFLSRLPLVGSAYLFLARKATSLYIRTGEFLMKPLANEVAKGISKHLDEDEAFNPRGAFYILSGGEGDGTIDLNHFRKPPEYDQNGYPKRPSRFTNLKNIFSRKK